MRTVDVTAEMNLARNMFGALSPRLRARIIHFIQNPCFETWDDISSIIINWASAEACTIWQAVICVDPTFPRSGRVTDQKGKMVREWERIPTVETLKKALEFATH
jgi:hypothetical protein